MTTDPSVGTPRTARAGFCQDRSEAGHRLQNVHTIEDKPLSVKPLWGMPTVPNVHHRLVASSIGRPSPRRKRTAVVGEWMQFRGISGS